MNTNTYTKAKKKQQTNINKRTFFPPKIRAELTFRKKNPKQNGNDEAQCRKSFF